MTMGNYVRLRREALGLSQTEAARRAGMHRSHLSDIERGKIALPNADVRRRLARALGVDHVAILIATGELTADEVGGAGGPCPLFAEGDPRHAICSDLRGLEDAELPAVQALIAGLRGHRRFRERNDAPVPAMNGLDG